MNEDPYVTVASFSYLLEASLFQSKLEAEGITCVLKDELMVQAYGFSSYAFGGVKLQVRESKRAEAVAILRAGGYHYSDVLETPALWRWFDYHTRHFPLLKNLLPEIRLLILLGVSAFALLLFFYWITE